MKRYLWSVLLGLLLPIMAHAQVDPPATISPLRVESDRNGVNLVDGRTQIDLPTLSVPAVPHLTFSRLQDVTPYLIGSIPAGDPDTSHPNFRRTSGRRVRSRFAASLPLARVWSDPGQYSWSRISSNQVQAQDIISTCNHMIF